MSQNEGPVRQWKTGLLRLIFGISHQGMSQISHMDADLMRPSSLEAAAHDRKAAVTFKNLIIGHGKAAAGRHNSHTHAVLGVSVDEGLNMAPVVLDIAPHNSNVCTFGFLVLDLLGKRQMSPIVFAQTMTPLVSLSRRCTMPGRTTPLIPDKSLQ